MLLDLQSRLADLIEGDEWFAGVPVITDRQPHPIAALQKAIASRRFAVVIGVASGEPASEPSQPGVSYTETFQIEVYQDPLHTEHHFLDALEHIIAAVHHQPAAAEGAGPRRFAARGHSTARGEDGLAVAVLRVETRNVVLSAAVPASP